jgi:hypothetical protein
MMAMAAAVDNLHNGMLSTEKEQDYMLRFDESELFRRKFAHENVVAFDLEG